MTTKRLKILHTVESYLPATNGMAEVVRQLSEYLVKNGHDVTVATSVEFGRNSENINGVHVVSFDISGNAAFGIQGEADRYRTYLIRSEFDIITNFAAQQWATDICIEVFDSIKAKKVFVPTGFSGLNNPFYQEYYDGMKEKMKWYDMSIFLSNNYRDINFARENGITKICVIPNGASKSEFLAEGDFDVRRSLALPENKKIILHVGSYTGVKGHDQALDIFLAANLQNAVLIFVGQNFDAPTSLKFSARFKWFRALKYRRFYRPWAIGIFFKYLRLMVSGKKQNVFLLKLSRQDLVSVYKQADVLLFPSMIECSPIVLFEAMASKTPFLVTDVGNAKEIIEWTGAGIQLPTTIDENGYSYANIKESAHTLKKMIGSDSKLRGLARNGYKIWMDRYTWEKIGEEYEKLYNQLVYAR